MAWPLSMGSPGFKMAAVGGGGGCSAGWGGVLWCIIRAAWWAWPGMKECSEGPCLSWAGCGDIGGGGGYPPGCAMPIPTAPPGDTNSPGIPGKLPLCLASG